MKTMILRFFWSVGLLLLCCQPMICRSQEQSAKSPVRFAKSQERAVKLQAQSAKSPVRFADSLFETVKVTESIPFSSALEQGKSEPTTLCFDFYEPASDTMMLRPLVITLYGGSFLGGSKRLPDMKAFGNKLAQHGYVVAAIDYRLLSLNYFSKTNIIRTAYMAVQDLSAAIRFFKADYLSYGIDTNHIFLIGNSAGSITILNELYFKEENRPEESYLEPDLGSVHASGYERYRQHTPDVAAVVAQWGGVMDLSIIDPDCPTAVCLLHGTADATVPLDSGYCFGAESMPYLYGSAAIAARFDALGMKNYELHLFEGERHSFYFDEHRQFIPEKFDTCFRIVCDFFYKNLLEPSNLSKASFLPVRLFPNPVSGQLQVCLPVQDEIIQGVAMFDVSGRKVLQQSYVGWSQSCIGRQPSCAGLQSVTIDVSALPAGVYLLQVYGRQGCGNAKVVVR